MRSAIISKASTLFFTFWLLADASNVIAQPQVGAPIKAIGTVSLARAETSRELEVSEPLYAGDIVDVGNRSYARLGFSSGWKVDVPALSVATLAWSPEPDTIFIDVGAVRGMSTPGASRITLVSGKAVAHANGTTFYFFVAPQGATSLYVEHGTVTFANRAGASVVVRSGQASTVSAAGDPPTPPAPPPWILLREAAAIAAQAPGTGVTTTPAARAAETSR